MTLSIKQTENKNTLHIDTQHNNKISTISKDDTNHYNTQHLISLRLELFLPNVDFLNILMLSAIMLNVVLSVLPGTAKR